MLVMFVHFDQGLMQHILASLFDLDPFTDPLISDLYQLSHILDYIQSVSFIQNKAAAPLGLLMGGQRLFCLSSLTLRQHLP